MKATTTRTSTSWGAGRILFVVIGAVLALNLALATVDRWTGGARPGPPSSTYTTDEEGLAAYADLLSRNGHPIQRLREPLSDTVLDPSATVIVLDASLSPTDVDALRRFVASGGRLVAGGTVSDWVRAIVPQPPTWAFAPAGTTRPATPVAEVAGVGQVISSGPGVYSDTGQALPALVGQRGSLLAVASVGPGRVALLAAAAPLHNRLLAQADNAAFGLALAGERGRAVVFAEYPHGYGAGQGWRAIPSRVRWALAGFALAAIAWMIGRSRRLGPPEQSSRELPPPRRAYVEALATTLSKSRRSTEAAAPVWHAARERIARMAGLPPEADERAWRVAAERLGMSDSEADALMRAPAEDEGVVEVGRAFARLEAMNR